MYKYLCICAILLIIFFYLNMSLSKEHFNNVLVPSLPKISTLSTPVLYPIKGLQAICAKEGLKPSFMPKSCYIGDQLNSYANCKCEDNEGNCKICYPTIKKDDSNSSVIYNANTASS